MKQIVFQDGEQDASPRINEISIYPNIDESFSIIPYEGERLITRKSQAFGIKNLGNMAASMQGVAIYGNTLVRMANGGTHYIYRLNDNGTVSPLATFSANTGHSNSLQFAPILEAGQTFPYLYAAYLDKICKVLSISSAYEVSIVQTITIGIAEVDGSCNIQIGDDGYIWAVELDSNDHYHFIKFRRVDVSEGDVSLTASDIVDEWTTQEAFPYSVYVWQGMIIRRGRIWLSYGQTQNSSQKRGIVVYDTTTHAYVTTLDLSTINQEIEDLDFWKDSVILCCYAAPYYLLEF